jgi:hypothetical protein
MLDVAELSFIMLSVAQVNVINVIELSVVILRVIKALRHLATCVTNMTPSIGTLRLMPLS